MPRGEYRLSWSELPGWIAPDPPVEDAILRYNEELVFTGTYSNEQPVACYTVSPDEGNISTLFTFDASCSQDAETAPSSLRFEWDWDGDGIYDESQLGDPVATKQFETWGLHDVVLRVTDEAGFSTLKTDPFEVKNEPPSACFEIEPWTGTTATTFAFDASCTADLEDSLPSMRFEWDWNGDGVYDESIQGDPAVSHMFAVPAVYEIKLRVTDSGDESAETNASVAVGVPAEFLPVGAGGFWMGAADGELGASEYDYPRHWVTLTRGFSIQSTEVTNQQYLELAQWAVDNGHAVIDFPDLLDAIGDPRTELLRIGGGIVWGDNRMTVEAPAEPVSGVSWYGAAAYCDWLNLRAGYPMSFDHDTWEYLLEDPYSSVGFRLPMEAEWEYACRAGSETAFANGEIFHEACEDPTLALIGWYCGNSQERVHQVATLVPNDWGLFDMHGNLLEWCSDWHDGEYYHDSPEIDPTGPADGWLKVLRGGSWWSPARVCRSACHYGAGNPCCPNAYQGFRPVRTMDLPPGDDGARGRSTQRQENH